MWTSCHRPGSFPYGAKLNVVARVLWDEEVEALRKLGVAEMVRPQFEVGLETIRHTLHCFGVTPKRFNISLIP